MIKIHKVWQAVREAATMPSPLWPWPLTFWSWK